MTVARLGGVVAVLAVLGIAVGLLVRGRDEEPVGPAAQALVEPACAPMTYGGEGRPSALVVLTTALQGDFRDHGVQAAQAVKLVLARSGWEAGEHTVGVQVCDEVPYGSDDSDPDRCRRIARALAPNQAVLGVIGLWSSTCAPLLTALNRAAGPVAVISPSATYLGLTREGPGVARGDPANFRPTGRRNFARVVPADDVQGAAGVIHLKRLGARRLFVLDDGLTYGRGLSGVVRAAAQQSGIELAGSSGWRAEARDYTALAREVRDARADAVYLAGLIDSNGPRLVRDLRRALGANVPLLGPDGFSDARSLVEGAGSAAEGFTYTIATLPNDRLPPAGRRFARDFERRFGDAPCCVSVQSAQAMEIFLDAIAASDGSRAGVTRNVLRARVTDGLLGRFSFDAAGDMSASAIGIYHVEGGRQRFDGAVVPPAAMLDRG